MGYTQVTIEERCEIARLRAAGTSIRQVAAGLDRAPSTVARELATLHAPWATGRRTRRSSPARALVRFPVGAGCGSASLRPRTPLGVVAGAGMRAFGARGGQNGHLLREHLPVHLRPGTRGTKTTAGGSICRRRSGNAAGVCAKGAVRSPSSSSVTRSPSARPLLQTGRPSATGRLT